MMNEDSGLNDLFHRYRAACPEVEPSANFMPAIWHRIESGRSFRLVFQQIARPLMAGSAALVLLLLLLNIVSSQYTRLTAPSYVDALMADHTAEKTYYTEALRSAPSPGETPAIDQR
jgi:Na+-transporting NADH:ubiquinone oxidoreductase subunit NqrB